MISHTSSISSSLGNCKSLFKEKDYDLIHYFDDQSDNEIDQEKKSKNINKKTSLFKENDPFIDNIYSSSDENSREDNFFIDDDSIYDTNEKVVEMSPDGNFGKVI
jgi:hypothetical protein